METSNKILIVSAIVLVLGLLWIGLGVLTMGGFGTKYFDNAGQLVLIVLFIATCLIIPALFKAESNVS